MNTNVWSVLFIPFHYILPVPPKLQNLLTKSNIALQWNSKDILLYPFFSDEITEAHGSENYFFKALSSFNKYCLEGCMSIVAT